MGCGLSGNDAGRRYDRDIIYECISRECTCGFSRYFGFINWIFLLIVSLRRKSCPDKWMDGGLSASSQYYSKGSG